MVFTLMRTFDWFITAASRQDSLFTYGRCSNAVPGNFYLHPGSFCLSILNQKFQYIVHEGGYWSEHRRGRAHVAPYLRSYQRLMSEKVSHSEAASQGRLGKLSTNPPEQVSSGAQPSTMGLAHLAKGEGHPNPPADGDHQGQRACPGATVDEPTRHTPITPPLRASPPCAHHVLRGGCDGGPASVRCSSTGPSTRASRGRMRRATVSRTLRRRRAFQMAHKVV